MWKASLHNCFCWFARHFREITYAKKLSFPRVSFGDLLLNKKKETFCFAKPRSHRSMAFAASFIMNNKTSGKYHASVTSSFSKTKVSRFLLFFAQQKISKRYPWKTEFFCICYFLKTKRKSTKTITQWCFSCQNKSVPKISSILQKIKIGPRCHIRPFCTKAFNWLYDVLLTEIISLC